MESHFWPVCLGGLAFFFFGLYSVRQGLQRWAGDELRAILLRLTDNRFKGFAFGALVTAILQSSSATIAMLVSFSGAGLLTLKQAFAVVLGSDVGTTAVVFLLAARHLVDYALYGVALGILLRLSGRQQTWRSAGEVIYGFGLVFYGLSLLVQAMSPLSHSQLVTMIFAQLSETPFWLMIGSALFAALIHSSAATLGLALTLAMAGVINLQGALPIVLGANIGTTITAMMAAFGGNINAKRVAGAHFITKAVGALIAFPLLMTAAHGLEAVTKYWPWLYDAFQGKLSFQIAVAHLLFNVGLALLFIPFLPLGVRMVSKLLPGSVSEEERFGPRYLDRSTLETPSLAYAQVHREVVRLSNLAHELFLRCLDLFKPNGEFYHLVEEIDEQDDRIDRLEKPIRFFLASLSQESLSEQQARTQIRLLRIASAFEEIGDTISKEMRALAEKQHERQTNFSDDGWRELRNIYHHVDQIFTTTVACLTTRSGELAQAVKSKTASLHVMENEAHIAHLQRLNEGLKESVETSSIHMDFLRLLARIGQKLSHIAQLSVEGD